MPGQILNVTGHVTAGQIVATVVVQILNKFSIHRILATFGGKFWMWSKYAHWVHWSNMLSVLTMHSKCVHWVYGPLSPVSAHSSSSVLPDQLLHQSQRPQIGDDMLIDRSDPDSTGIVVDQLWTLSDHHFIHNQGRVVEVFNSLGNVRPELLVENAGVGVVIGSGELSLESSDNGLDRGESFAFGNNGSD